MASEKKKKKDNVRSDNLMLRALHGRLVSTEFFTRNWISVALLTVLLVGFITNKYECQTNMETIQKLEKELEIVRTEKIREHARYMSRIRESAMTRLVREHDLDLHVQDDPPYTLTLSE